MRFTASTTVLALALSAAPVFAEKLPPSLRRFRVGLAGSQGREVAGEAPEGASEVFRRSQNDKRALDVGGPHTVPLVSTVDGILANVTSAVGAGLSSSDSVSTTSAPTTAQRTRTTQSIDNESSYISSVVSSIDSVRSVARASVSAAQASSLDAAFPDPTVSASTQATSSSTAEPAPSSTLASATGTSAVASSTATATTAAPFESIAGMVSGIASQSVATSTESGTVLLSTSFVSVPAPTATTTADTTTTTATPDLTPSGLLPLLNSTIIPALLNDTMSPLLSPAAVSNQTVVTLPSSWASAFGNATVPAAATAIITAPVASVTGKANETVVAVTSTLSNGTTVESTTTIAGNGTTAESTGASRGGFFTSGGVDTATALSTPTAATNATLPTPTAAVNQTTSADGGFFSTGAATTTTSLLSATSTDSYYAWVPTSTLFINPPESTITSKPTPLVAGAKTTTVDGAPSITIVSQYPFPTNLPSKIVPAAAAMGVQPQDSTLVSLLFDQSLSWTWMVQNSNASGQVLFYTPLVIMVALGLTNASDVQTVALEAFQPVTFDGDASKLLTVFLAFVPASSASDLQAMVSAPTSQFYQQSGIQSQIAAAVVPTFSIFSYSSTAAAPGTGDSSALSASDTSANAAADAGKQRSNTIIIAVVVSFGVVMLALAGWAAFRSTKRGAILLSSRQQEPRTDPHHREFQLGQGGRMQTRDSTSSSIASSSSSRSSTGSDPFSSHEATAGGGSRGHGTSSSVDVSDRRGSWWRFSSGSAGGHGSNDGPVGMAYGGEMREQNHRRINVLRGPNGAVDSGAIGRPQIQSNSLML